MSTSLYSVHDNFNARIGSAKPPTSTSAASVVLQTAAEVTPWRETAEGHGTLQPIAPETSHVVLPRDPPTSALNRGAFTAEEATAAARINAHVRELAERVSAYASFAEEVLRVEAVKSFTASAFAILKRASAGRVQEQDIKKLSEELFTHWVMHVSNDAAYAPGLDSITRLPPGSSTVPSQSQRLRQQAILSIDAGKVVFRTAAVSPETSEAERVTGTLAGPVDPKNWELVTITDSTGRVHEFPAADVFLAAPEQIDPDVLIPTGEAYPDRGTCVVVYQRCLHATKADKAASKIAALEITARATSLRVALGAAKDRIGAIVAAALSKLSSGTAADALPIFNEISALASELTGGMQRLPIFSSMSEVAGLVTRGGSIAFRSVIAAEGRGSQVLELSCGSVTCPVLSAAYERFKALYANAGGLEIFDAESETAKHDRVVALAAKVPSMAPAPWSVDVTPVDDTHAAPPAHTLKPEVPEGVVLSGPQPEGRTVALGSPNTPFDTLAFHLRLMTVLLRYFALAGASDMCDLNAGFHAAIHPEFMRALRTEFGVSAECFGSPFNAVSPRFCSLFPDVDRYFGSCGKFFDFAPSSVNGGAFHVNPPFATNVMQRMAGRMLDLLSDDGSSTTDATSAQPDEDSTAAETTTANSAADDDSTVGASATANNTGAATAGSKPLTFVMVIPSWTGPKLEAALKSVMQSEYCVFRTEISPGDAVYIDGHQHALGRPYFALETKTLMAVFQNKAAQRKFSSDEFKVLPSVLAKQKPKHELVVRAMAGRCIQQWALASQTALPSQPKKRAR